MEKKLFTRPYRAKRRRHWLLILAGLAVLMWGAYEVLLVKAEAKLQEQLSARGVRLTFAHKQWSLRHGLSLEGAALEGISEAHEPLLQISKLHLDFLWWESWRAKEVITRWQCQDATLTLHDAEGAVSLRALTADVEVRPEAWSIHKFATTNAGTAFALTGEINPAPSTPGAARIPLQLDLHVLRSVLDGLNFPAATHLFTIAGTFTVDLRQTPAVWQTDLRGSGQGVGWQGVPITDAQVTAQLSERELHAVGNLKLAQGEVAFTLTREGWDAKPLDFVGVLKDSDGQADDFKGAFLASSSQFTISQLSGNADLLTMARNVPALAAKLNPGLTVQTFPDLMLKRLVIATRAPFAWTLESLRLQTPAALTVIVQKHPLVIHDLQGGLAFRDGEWQLREISANMLGGRAGMKGNFDGKTLREATLSLDSVQLAKLAPWVGKVKASIQDSELTLNYAGVVCLDPAHSTGDGSLVLTHTPVVHVPLLDEAYALFPQLLEHGRPEGEGELHADFHLQNGLAKIEDFKATSASLVVMATGTVDLVQRQVNGQARANLRNLAGIATAPLSHLLMQMSISGPFEDIQVAPSGPIAGAKKLVTGTTSAATGGVKLGSEVLRQGLTLPLKALEVLSLQAAP